MMKSVRDQIQDILTTTFGSNWHPYESGEFYVGVDRRRGIGSHSAAPAAEICRLLELLPDLLKEYDRLKLRIHVSDKDED